MCFDDSFGQQADRVDGAGQSSWWHSRSVGPSDDCVAITHELGDGSIRREIHADAYHQLGSDSAGQSPAEVASSLSNGREPSTAIRSTFVSGTDTGESNSIWNRPGRPTDA